MNECINESDENSPKIDSAVIDMDNKPSEWMSWNEVDDAYEAEELAKHAKEEDNKMKEIREDDENREIVNKAQETDTVTTDRPTIFSRFQSWIGKRLRTATVCCGLRRV